MCKCCEYLHYSLQNYAFFLNSDVSTCYQCTITVNISKEKDLIATRALLQLCSSRHIFAQDYLLWSPLIIKEVSAINSNIIVTTLV